MNEQNLRAMLVDPQDEFRGTGATTTRGDTAARAVTRLLTDRRRTLLDASLAHVGATPGAGADAPLPISGPGAAASGSVP
ncbi:MAG: hypothetical protein RQ966_05925 [Acetobacteraceae bacterium]|nr:hypothetical protein [Acetobacteraceae bacterium]